MNYLAHAYLSFSNEEIMVGNMISDFVKGKRKFDYPAVIQKGIALHRSIDQFTDGHAATKQAKEFLKPAVGLYAGAFIDVVYDHFLAVDGSNWDKYGLGEFSSGVYDVLTRHHDHLPERLQQMLPYMKSQDWLFNYQFTWGIEKSFQGIVRRAAYLERSDAAFAAFIKHYSVLEHLSQSFLTDVKKFAFTQFRRLVTD